MKSGESSCFSSIAIVLLGFRSPNFADLQSFSEPMRSSIPGTISRHVLFWREHMQRSPCSWGNIWYGHLWETVFLGGETTVFHGLSCDFALKHIDKPSFVGSMWDGLGWIVPIHERSEHRLRNAESCPYTRTNKPYQTINWILNHSNYDNSCGWFPMSFNQIQYVFLEYYTIYHLILYNSCNYMICDLKITILSQKLRWQSGSVNELGNSEISGVGLLLIWWCCLYVLLFVRILYETCMIKK